MRLEETEQPMHAPTPREPVLCGDCLHYQQQTVAHTSSIRHRCWHPHAKEEVITFAEKQIRYHDADERNTHNDCRDWEAYRLTWRGFERMEPVGATLLCLLGTALVGGGLYVAGKGVFHLGIALGLWLG